MDVKMTATVSSWCQIGDLCLFKDSAEGVAEPLCSQALNANMDQRFDISCRPVSLPYRAVATMVKQHHASSKAGRWSKDRLQRV